MCDTYFRGWPKISLQSNQENKKSKERKKDEDFGAINTEVGSYVSERVRSVIPRRPASTEAIDKFEKEMAHRNQENQEDSGQDVNMWMHDSAKFVHDSAYI